MNSNLLVIVPCSKTKIWKDRPSLTNVQASQVYTSTSFKINKAFAEKFADKWIILSAKYGFIEPDFNIPEDYDVTFNDPNTHPITTPELKHQFQEMDLEQYDLIIALGGTNYTDRVIEVAEKSTQIATPATGIGLGYGLQYVKSLTALVRREMIKTLFRDI